MSLYLSGDFDAFDASHKLTELRKELLKTVGKRSFKLSDGPHKAILAKLQLNPGLYIAELYSRLVGGGVFNTTYTTLWSDVRFLDGQKQLMTVGGPQGSPRYCFLHPKAIQDRREFYNRFFCTEGIVDKNLTDAFSMRKRWFEVYRVNSMTKAMILVLEYGAIRENIIGSRVKSFGRLHKFESIPASQGLDPKPGAEPADVLKAINVTRVRDGKEETIWHHRPYGGTVSLYSS